MRDADAVAATLAAIRARAPLVHNVTGEVVANATANALLAVGASPAMVEHPVEVAGFARRADAVVVNLGSLTEARARAMLLAAAAAHSAGRPWVLDPVAVGAHAVRARLVAELLAYRPSAIRGNASEVASLAGPADGVSGAQGWAEMGRLDVRQPEGGRPEIGRGVDATEGSAAVARLAAEALARRTGAIVAVTGAVDHVTDGTTTYAIANGDALMTRVTGMGCTATALVGACLAVQPDALAATLHAVALIGIAGEIAAMRSRGPGSMQAELLDALHVLDAKDIGTRLRCTRM